MTDLELIYKIDKKIGFKLKETSLNDFLETWRSYRTSYNYVLSDDKQIIALRIEGVPLNILLKTDLSQFKSIKYLRLRGCNIRDISFLKDYKELMGLNLDRNKINDISSLQELNSLTQLELGGNQISDISPLQELKSLTLLWLLENQISDISPLKELKSLTLLYLAENQINDISPLKELKGLTVLSLWRNQISNISPLQELKSLTSLGLWDNQISDISPLQELKSLTDLDLSYNQIIDIYPLQELKSLTKLELRKNPIQKLPVWITDFNIEIQWKDESREDGFITFFDNPLKSPPVEIVKKGKTAIKVWFRGAKVNVNEVKVLLVGHGDVGKTTLVKCLTGVKPDPKESSTHNIRITPHTIPYKKKDIKVNFWDFGGQEVMHSTHQFFLSKRSLYILVLDGRRDEDAEYWLKHIESFGGDSPVIVVLNKADANPAYDLNRQFLKQKFPFVQGFYKTACFSRTNGVKELQKGFIKALSNVKILKEKWPAEWFAVKEILEGIQDDFISQNNYDKFCEKNGITDDKTKEILAEYLNDLGVVVHFKDLRLCDLHILNPRWASRAAYKIINSKKVADNHGLLKEEWLNGIMKKADKNDFVFKRENFPYILELMKKFELCYSLKKDTYLLPELMDIQQPSIPKHKGPVLKFFLKYEVLLPPSIMPRFIVRMHKDIKKELRWRTGVVLEIPIFGTMAVIISDIDKGRIDISVSGIRRREHFAIIRKTFHDLKETFDKLSVTEWIPLPDEKEYAVEYDELIGLEEQGEEKIKIGKLKKSYNVKDLLNGIEPENVRKEEYQWDVFLCHSSIDKETIRKIANDLKANNISYWLDEEQIDPGDSVIDEITDGLQRSRYIMPCISESQLKSGWARKEYQSILYRVISGTTKQRVTPLILDDTPRENVPLFLGDIQCERYSEPEEYKKMLEFLKSKIVIKFV